VHHECHPGAIYLHGGDAFLVHTLDRDRRRAEVDAVRADHYTVVLGDKETEILSRDQTRRIGPGTVYLGRLKVTLRVREYQKRRLFDGEPISQHPLDLPPVIFETVGLWIELSQCWPAAFAARELHFMGGIHAVEHALIGLFPLLAIAERGDVGGISYTGHPQVGGPAIFIYDAQAGGAGLAEQGYHDLETLFDRCRELLCNCACDDGCPACIQSPQCGNGNRPLDKRAAALVLRAICGEEEIPEIDGGEVGAPSLSPSPAARRKTGIVRAGNIEGERAIAGPSGPGPGPVPAPAVLAPVAAIEFPPLATASRSDLLPVIAPRWLVFDVETQRSAAEVGGWAQTARMGLALAVVCDLGSGEYRTYFEADVHRLLLDLVMADRVIGFNIERFDLSVLAAYTPWDLSRVRTLDLLVELHRRLGFRVSLNHLAEVNLGRSKSASGEQSLRWWKEGRLDLIESYCRQDVEITRQIYELGRDRGHLLVRERSGRTVRVGVDW
jgi:DEAD/DEAH box helicase domain-containing protein